MKKIKQVIIIAGICLVIVPACSFNVKTAKSDTAESVVHNDPEHNHKYVCPMYCTGSGSDSAGTCPVCNMDYIKNPKLNKKEKKK